MGRVRMGAWMDARARRGARLVAVVVAATTALALGGAGSATAVTVPGAPGGPLVFNPNASSLGQVEHSPRLYLIFWGDWGAQTPLSGTDCGGSECDATQLKAQLLTFYDGLSGSGYQQMLSQYADAAGPISTTVHVPYPNGYSDPTVPTLVNAKSIHDEARAMAQQNGWDQGDPNNQFIVLPAPGTNYQGDAGFSADTAVGSSTLTAVSGPSNLYSVLAPGETLNGPGIPNGTTIVSWDATANTITMSAAANAKGTAVEIGGLAIGACGYHNAEWASPTDAFVWSFVPYGPDVPAPPPCVGAGTYHNNDEVVTASHEYAEAATDPIPGTGWINPTQSAVDGGEIADICSDESYGPADVAQVGIGTVALLWDNANATCNSGDPVVTGVSPGLGPATSQTPVTITGSGFTGATTVNFGAAGSVTPTTVTDSSITVTAPAGTDATGGVDVTVTSPMGTSPVNGNDRFVYGPTAAQMFPTSVPATGNVPVTITGTGFDSDGGIVSVLLSRGTVIVPASVQSETSLTFTPPPGIGGNTGVGIITGNGDEVTLAGASLGYAPVVTGVSPAGVPVGVRTPITITGAGFTGATAVDFGGLGPVKPSVASDTQLTVTAPAGSDSTGYVDLQVVGPGGTSDINPFDQFVYGPSVTAISPTAGPTTGGSQLQLSGTGFLSDNGVRSVTVGGMPATIVPGSTTDTSLTVTTPAATSCAGGAAAVVVTMNGTGETIADSVTAPQSFAYTSVSPSLLVTAQPAGQLVTVGSTATFSAAACGLPSAPTMQWQTSSDGGATWANVAGATSSPLTVANVQAAQSGTQYRAVFTTSAGSVTTNAATLTVRPAPVVTGVSPNTGSANSVVFITGKNLSGMRSVSFGAGHPSHMAIAAGATEIVALVPSGPPSGTTVDVQVTTVSGTSAVTTADRFKYR